MSIDVSAPSSPPVETPLYTDAVAGLKQSPKTIPPKYLYDERGSELFSRICELPEYYLTRTELALTSRHIDDIAAHVGSRACLVELGAGDGRKCELLLRHLHRLSAYVPVEISEQQLRRSVQRLTKAFSDIDIRPVCADYTADFDLPKNGHDGRTVFYFPGSTIGNFEPEAARRFLTRLSGLAGPRGALLIGVDLDKEQSVLESAYNDSAGVTAEFNLNLLRRLNRECDADFDPSRFSHQAVYQPEARRIEMRLISDCEQSVHFPTARFDFDEDEFIVSEHSYKFTIDQFATLAEKANWRTRAMWVDDQRLFSLWFLERTN